MQPLTRDIIRDHVADSPLIFERGEALYRHGSFLLKDADPANGRFEYAVDGSYGDYVTRIVLDQGTPTVACTCPYPGRGCKHVVAALLNARDILDRWQPPHLPDAADAAYLSPEEIRRQAIEDRRQRARSEAFRVAAGDMVKGEHGVTGATGRHYTVTLHDPAAVRGHCTCPDYLTNRLGVCKHILHLCQTFGREKGFRERMQAERFPFLDIYWDSSEDAPRMFHEEPQAQLAESLRPWFDAGGGFVPQRLDALLELLPRLDGDKRARVRETVLKRLDDHLAQRQLEALAAGPQPSFNDLRIALYPYQEAGVAFGLYKRACLIGDEMGLGKTLQAIALALRKRRVFDFRQVVVVTMASLKEQWKREIERFSDARAAVVAGSPRQRRDIYRADDSFFKITNYEAVLRDVAVLRATKPDLVILDEAQRIKNFSTKTAAAVKAIPRKHALVLTGTPLENRLEDVYSIVQFLDPHLLTPLWQFAADHFMLSRAKKNHILGYRNLDRLHARLKPLVIRRRKEEVLSDLPEEVVNTYYVAMDPEQAAMHAGYAALLAPLLGKKHLTPMDLRRIQELLLRMRQSCNATYLIDRNTNISPKLQELAGILDELVVQNGRKAVIFSEWTTMTFLIARQLSQAGIPFVELSGKIPVPKRQALIDEFTANPDCKVFLSTDAGGTGLNLQAAEAVINFEPPWNPARLRQRIGRVNRIGQRAGCINVVHLIAKRSIEERILAGIQLKSDLFEGVFDGGCDMVEFSQERRTELVNQLREMLGEEELVAAAEAAPAVEIPEDAPHYLNPRVLDAPVDVTAEEAAVEEETASGSAAAETASPSPTSNSSAAPPAASAEKMEEIMNSGMKFLGGLLEAATGRALQPAAGDRLVTIDRDTGEVTLKFKLPGF